MHLISISRCWVWSWVVILLNNIYIYLYQLNQLCLQDLTFLQCFPVEGSAVMMKGNFSHYLISLSTLFFSTPSTQIINMNACKWTCNLLDVGPAHMLNENEFLLAVLSEVLSFCN